MNNRNAQKTVFSGKGRSFVSIVDDEKRGGAQTMLDFLRMRSSQLVRQMRTLPEGSTDQVRVKLALKAMSEATRLVEDLRKPKFAPPAQTEAKPAS